MMENTLKQFSKTEAKELAEKLLKLNIKEAKGEGTFEVIATTEGVDRDGEVIMIDGWDFDNFMKNPVLLFGHDYWSFPIGAVTDLKVEDGKVIASGIFARTDEGQKARILYEDGILKTVSVGFIAKERQGNVITKAELLELSFVPVPSNPEALDTRKEIDGLEKILRTNVQIEKTVVAFEETPTIDESEEWDEKAAIAKIKELASDEDGNIDFDVYKKGFAWFDGSDAESESAYKLAHHIVVGDGLAVVWQGALAAMSKLLSGEIEIPEGEKEGVYNHLKKHYEQFGKEAPEFKSYSQYELDNLFPEEKEQISDDHKSHIENVIKTLESDVNHLLTDAVEKIKSVTGVKKECAEPITKAGRTLSSKTRTTVNSAVEAMGKATKELKELLEAADTSSSDDEKAANKTLLKQLQGLDKGIEKAIKSVKLGTK